MTLELLAHQIEMGEFITERERVLIAAEMGTMKTVATLATCDAVRKPTLVLAPRSVMRAAWVEDLQHFTGLVPVVYHGPKRKVTLERASDDHDPADLIVITTPETFRRDAKYLADLGIIARLVIDESSKIKNPESKVSLATHYLADRVDILVLLSGTPAPNGPHEYWSQLRAIDPTSGGLADSPLNKLGTGPRFSRWAGYWLNPIERYLPSLDRNQVIGWEVKPSLAVDFAEMLSRVTYRIAKADCLDLPEKVERIVRVELGSERSVYDEIESDLAAELEDGVVTVVKAEAMSMKLRQIAGGSFKGKPAWQSVGSAKLSALSDLIDELGTAPFLIWCQFRHESDRISQLLDDMKIPHGKCNGTVSGAEVDKAIRDFKAGEIRALICNSQTVGHGVTLVKSGDRPCSTAIYYSMDFSYERHAQSLDRIHRPGQTEPCTYLYLAAVDTVDEAMAAAVRNKENVSKAMLDSVRARQTKGTV